MPKILIIAGNHFKYWAADLQDIGGMTTTLISPEHSIAFARDNELTIDIIIVELYQGRGPKEINWRETDGGMIAGVVIVKALMPICKNADFFLLGGASLTGNHFGGSKSVVALPKWTGFTPAQMAGEIRKQAVR
jgi:hypothetical protein